MSETHKRPTASKLEFKVRNTQLKDSEGARDVVVLANGGRLDGGSTWLSAEAVAEQVSRFPEGQFVAVVDHGDHEEVIGSATTMRTNRGPDQRPLRWMEMIGSYGIAAHDPRGRWLYGVEIAVRPEYRRRGVATALYKVRLGLVEKLGLEGWYAGGMLMGYHRYRDRMSPQEYYRKVLSGEIEDPTVTMQMHRGLQPRGLIEGYAESPAAGNNAVLLVWQPAQRRRKPRRSAGVSVPAAAATRH